MKRSEVYSWRVEPHLKEALERAARTQNTSVASLLACIVGEWLDRDRTSVDDQAVQDRVRERAAEYLGSIRGDDPLRAGEASRRVRQVLGRKRAGRGHD